METISGFFLSLLICSADLKSCEPVQIFPPFYRREDCVNEALKKLEANGAIQAYKCVEQKLDRS